MSERHRQRPRKGDVKTNLNFFFQIDDYILTKSKKASKGMTRIYRNMKYHSQEFEAFRQKPITSENLDFTFYEDLVSFLTYEYIQKRSKDPIIGLKANTIGKTIKHFRTFLRTLLVITAPRPNSIALKKTD